MADDNHNADAPSPEGGSGGGLGSIRPRGRADTKLIERAIRERWNIPAEFRDAVVRRQLTIAMDPTIGHREATSAARCLVAMDQQNLTAELQALQRFLAGESAQDTPGASTVSTVHIYLPDNGRVRGGRHPDIIDVEPVDDGGVPPLEIPPEYRNGHSSNGNGKPHD